MRRTTLLAFSSVAALGLIALAACSSDDAGLVPVTGGPTKTRLETDTGVTWVIEVDPGSGTARLAFPKDPTPQIFHAGDDAAVVAAAFVAQYPETFGVKAPGDLDTVESVTDAGGVTHVRFRQKVQGAPAEFAVLDVHFDDGGGISHISGPFYPTLAQTAGQTPAITPAVATQAALTGAIAYGVPGPAARGTPTLEVGLDAAGRPLLQYRVPLTATDGARLEARVDAMTGAYLQTLRLDHTYLSASGTGMGGARETFEIDDPGAGQPYAMLRSKQGNKPQIQVLASDASGGLAGITSTSLDDWEQSAAPNGKGSAVDAIAKLQKVEAWYRSKFGWLSLDNQGANIDVYVYVPTDSNPNAFYAGGRGAGTDRYFAVYLSAQGIAPHGDGHDGARVHPRRDRAHEQPRIRRPIGRAQREHE